MADTASRWFSSSYPCSVVTSHSPTRSCRPFRGLRVPLPGRGKRGGGRVIYYLWTALDCCYLVFAYAKNVQGDLTAVQLQRLAKVVEEELDDG